MVRGGGVEENRRFETCLSLAYFRPQHAVQTQRSLFATPDSNFYPGSLTCLRAQTCNLIPSDPLLPLLALRVEVDVGCKAAISEERYSARREAGIRSTEQKFDVLLYAEEIGRAATPPLASTRRGGVSEGKGSARHTADRPLEL